MTMMKSRYQAQKASRRPTPVPTRTAAPRVTEQLAHRVQLKINQLRMLWLLAVKMQ